MNANSNNTSPAETAIPPSAEEYSLAFFQLEDQIIRLHRHAKLVDHLLGRFSDDTSERLLPGDAYRLEITYGTVADLREEVDQLQKDYFASFEDLVSRENAAGRLEA